MLDQANADAAIIVFARADGGKLTSADSAKVASVAAALNARHISSILGVTAGPASPNGLVQTALVSMDNSVLNGKSNDAGDAVKVLRADIAPLIPGSDLTEGVTGTAAQQLDSEQSGNRAQEIVTLATLVLILILLLLIFRSPIIALLPLLVIAIVSQVATGCASARTRSRRWYPRWPGSARSSPRRPAWSSSRSSPCCCR